MSIRDAVDAIVIATILLFSLSKPICRVRLSLSNAFWCSFIAHVIGALLALVGGFLLPSHLGIALVVALVIVWFFQTTFLQLAARTQNETIARWRAGILSLIAILGDFLIASPLIHLWEQYRSNA